jgi:mono/diheme cytochrome c family protein
MLSHRMPARTRRLFVLAASVLVLGAGAGVAACGEEGVSVPASDRQAADLFVEHCAGCHTLGVAGTHGSATNVRTREYKDGPNFDQRKETKECVLYAIRNGGFSSGPMPQDIVVGEDAEKIAAFVAEFSGSQKKVPKGPAVNVSNCPLG